jgi:hypothetical protein
LARHGHVEGYPTTRRRAAHRAHVVPRASVNRPSSRNGFVQGRSFTPDPRPCAASRVPEHQVCARRALKEVCVQIREKLKDTLFSVLPTRVYD